MGNKSSVESSEEFNYLIQRSGVTKAGKCTEQWAVFYNIMGRSCKLALSMSHGVGMKGDEKFSISIEDAYLQATFIINPFSNPQRRADIHFYGGKSERKGFVFVNLVYKPWAREPYALTLTHYLALCTEKIDLGLSVKVIIKNSRWSSNSGLELKGPIQHPASAIFKMFNYVREGSYPKCPHCEYGDRNSSSHLLPSESEDSDNSLSIQSQIGQIMKGLLNNGGKVTGNGNGNMYIDLGSKR
ncbi:hypothetical protein PIB30_057257 [Stylosanthes scabra]|uniref:Uncharacterized protein n=1 Tax=Stylosanthes scabra TaxID=79078 RepID=A0ABU6WJL6_9FABA|nr:hypothetical protein [Stylosanthes scabra]